MNVIPLLALGYALTLTKGKKTADRLEYFPLNLEVIKGKLVYSMEILNPTKNKLTIDSFFAGIFIEYNKPDKSGDGGKHIVTKIGNIERGKEFEIAPNKRTEIKFPVKLNPMGSLILLDVIRGKVKSPTFKILGIARALGLDNDVSKEISLNV